MSKHYVINFLSKQLLGVGGWVSPVTGIEEGTYCMEHWV